MARKVNENMFAAVRQWLESKNISPDTVLTNFKVSHENGQTQLTLTFVVDDFPLQPAEAKAECTCLNGIHLRHRFACPLNEVRNRPHTTCIDVTTAAERPYSSWVCGPDCPPAQGGE